jgi:mannose-6-phosphate isomerase
MDILRLGPNRPAHFYRGGLRIASFRGIDDPDDTRPEDWIASVTHRADDDSVGLTVLPDRRLLRDVVAADPEAYLGPDHVAAFGADPALLVKMLDPAQRLPVHVHPDAAFAAHHLGCAHGKTEAWLILDAEPDAAVYLGFRDDVSDDVMRAWVRDQDVHSLLGSLNRLPARRGDAFLVPAGVPHAIGDGLLLVELQEPTDFSIFMEWEGFSLDPSAGHLGLGFDRALEAVDRSARDPSALRSSESADPPRTSRPLPDDADRFFRADVLRPGADGIELEPAWTVLIVAEGAGQLERDSQSTAVHRGDVLLVPWGVGPVRVSGEATVIRCRPPAAPDHSR